MVNGTAAATILSIFLLAGPASLSSAQEVTTSVVPRMINVGDVFRVNVRVIVPAGTTVSFPDTLDVPEHVEAAARRELIADTTGGEETTYTAVYPLAAWRPGRVQLPAARVVLTGPGRRNEVEATFRPIEIASILPPDTSEIEPRPVRDVLGPSRLVWPVVVGVLVILAAVVAAVWLIRRRYRPDQATGPAIPPRAVALEELERIRRLGYLERNELRLFYTAIAQVLRRYTAQLDPLWGEQLTTTELWGAMTRMLGADTPGIAGTARAAGAASGAGAPAPPGVDRAADGSNEAGELYSMLGRADLVKFARALPAVAEADAVWTEARAWVVDFPPPLPAEPGEEVAE